MPVLFILAVTALCFAAFMASTYKDLATGLPMMDRPAIRYNVLKEAELNGLDPKIFMALIFSESSGDPANFVGDNGRSFGPGQFNVYDERGNLSATAIQFGYTGNGSDLLDEGLGIHYAALVLKDKLAAANGIYQDAILAYKGGANPNQTAYAERDLVFKDYTDKLHYS